MIYNVLQYLENSAERCPDKIALEDEFGSVTYREYEYSAKTIGAYISRKAEGVTGAGCRAHGQKRQIGLRFYGRCLQR